MRCMMFSLVASIAMSATLAFAEGDAGSAEPVPDPWKSEEVPLEKKSEKFGQGFYLRLGGATGFEMGLADETATSLEFVFGPPVSVDISPAIGLDARIGARGGYFGSEVQIEWLPNFTVDASAGGSQLPDIDYRYVSATGNLQLILSTGRIQPYLMFGFGGMWVSTSPELITISGLMIRGGGGVDIFLNDHLALATDLSYVYPTGDVSGGDYLALDWGLKYVF